MLKYNHVMVDIETLATSDRALVLSIGAVAFAANGDIEPTGLHVELDPSLQSEREISVDTTRWWLSQPDAIRSKAFSGNVDPASALEQLALYITRHARGAAVWANGPQFDLVILRSLARDFKVTNIGWHYRDERDFRTLSRLAGPVEGLPPKTDAHDALADARWQARAAILMAAALKRGF